MGDYSPKFKPGEAITRTCSAALTGGQLMTVAGAVAGANDTTWLGVASHDTAASGDLVGCYVGGIQRLTVAGALAAGTRVKCAANGRITTFVAGTDAVDTLVGITLEASTNAGDVIAVSMVR